MENFLVGPANCYLHLPLISSTFRLSLFDFPALIISVTDAGILNTKIASSGQNHCIKYF